jgi:lipopolysaccharide/colanic/teichoic acid biosynthesis glycosyltransferase
VPAVIKRAFDILFAGMGLVLLVPLLAIVALLIKLDSKGPVFFKQERIGRRFHPFHIYKFRTMRDDRSRERGLITVGADPRITQVGGFLRKTKLDELPQLINVLKGDMSFVGPRPEVPKYVQVFRRDYEDILRVRPGITDLASLKYRDEAFLLGKAENPEEEYLSHVLPDKIKLAKDYVQRSSLLFDVGLILKTMFKVFNYKVSS